MSFSLDTQSIQTLKSEAKALRVERSGTGEAVSHAQALEAVARAHGFRDWNTARASLPDRCVVDGELIVEVDGRLDFDALGQRIHPADSRVRLLAGQTPAAWSHPMARPVIGTAALLIAAARADHVEQLIKPSLEAGKVANVVVCYRAMNER